MKGKCDKDKNQVCPPISRLGRCPWCRKEMTRADNRDQSLSFSNPTSRSIFKNVGECAIRLD